MRGNVWPGDITPSQLYGFTSLLVEPLWLRRHFHCGVDLPLPVGTPLRAPFDGKITYVGYALLAMTDGFVTAWFVHIDRSIVAKGQTVSRDQVICYSGSKVPSGGSSTGPHLHLEFQNTPLPLHGAGGSSAVNNAGEPGNLNYPASSLDPADVLAGRFSAGGGELNMATVDDLLASGGELRGKGGNSKLDLMVGPNGLGGGQLDRIEVLLKGVAASEAAEVAQAVADAHALQDKLTAGFADLKAALAVNTAQGFADLKLAIDGLKVAGGGLTPEQDAEVSAIEASLEQLKQQLAAGLKVDITAIGKP